MAGAVLSAHEREEIRVGLEAEEFLSDIARRLGRVPSTITREVKRNGGRRRYCAVRAQGRSERLRSRPKATAFQGNESLARHVERRLIAKDSPTTIAIELARAGGIEGDTVSPETIYQGVYAHGTRGLVKGLGRHLHRKRGRRRRRCRTGETRKKASPLGAFNLIHQRPKIASGRREVGHFEGDLIVGAMGKSAIVTLVDRASRFNLIGDLPGGHGAENVLACCIELFERVPVELRRSLTWDRVVRWLVTRISTAPWTSTSTSPTRIAPYYPANRDAPRKQRNGIDWQDLIAVIRAVRRTNLRLAG